MEMKGCFRPYSKKTIHEILYQSHQKHVPGVSGDLATKLILKLIEVKGFQGQNSDLIMEIKLRLTDMTGP